MPGRLAETGYWAVAGPSYQQALGTDSHQWASLTRYATGLQAPVGTRLLGLVGTGGHRAVATNSGQRALLGTRHFCWARDTRQCWALEARYHQAAVATTGHHWAAGTTMDSLPGTRH